MFVVIIACKRKFRPVVGPTIVRSEESEKASAKFRATTRVILEEQKGGWVRQKIALKAKSDLVSFTDCRPAAELGPRRQSGQFDGFCLFIRVIYTILLADTAVIYIFINNCKFVFLFILC